MLLPVAGVALWALEVKHVSKEPAPRNMSRARWPLQMLEVWMIKSVLAIRSDIESTLQALPRSTQQL